MRIHPAIAVLPMLWLSLPWAGAARAAGGPCDAAIAAAEAEQGIPAGLLAAIAMVESAAPDPAGGPARPWPWSIDVIGQSQSFASREAAIAAVAALQAQGVGSIDVGCLQVNLAQHPGAFADLAAAFDPVANARYAARFLAHLAAQLGDWTAAVGAYHSRTPGLGEPYRAKVLAIWNGRPDAPPVAALAVRTGPPPDWLLAARTAPPPPLPAPVLPWPQAGGCAWGAGACAGSPFASVAALRLALAAAAP